MDDLAALRGRRRANGRPKRPRVEALAPTVDAAVGVG